MPCIAMLLYKLNCICICSEHEHITVLDTARLGAGGSCRSAPRSTMKFTLSYKKDVKEESWEVLANQADFGWLLSAYLHLPPLISLAITVKVAQGERQRVIELHGPPPLSCYCFVVLTLHRLKNFWITDPPYPGCFSGEASCKMNRGGTFYWSLI